MRLYPALREARFLSRTNRFIAQCMLDGNTMVCHVKNTGRLRELLLPDARVWIAPTDNPARKTAFDLVAVEKNSCIVNVDSQAPNAVFAEWLRSGACLPEIEALRPETTFGTSRFDFAFISAGQSGYAEVKGVTLLDDDGCARFPDAPTERGLRHVHELIAAKHAGHLAILCFVVMREDACCMKPNDATQPAFGDALRAARAAGVQLIAASCRVTPDGCTIDHTLPVLLD